jgi:hypothetical protein
MLFIISLYDEVVRLRSVYRPAIYWLVGVSISATAGPSTGVPQFENYRVVGIYHGESKPPQFGGS